MSIVDVKEDYKGETLQASVDEQRSTVLNPILLGDYTRSFDVLFDDSIDTRYGKSIIAQKAYLYGWPIMPLPFSVLASDPWTYVDRYTVDVAGPLFRKVHVHYKTFVDPATLPIEKEILFQPTTDILDYSPAVFSNPSPPSVDGIPDSEAMALTNSADEPFDPPIVKEYKDMVLRFSFIRQYDAAYLSELCAAYVDAVNADTFYGFVRGKVKCTSVAAQEKQIGPYKYWAVQLEFTVRHFRSDPLNCGWIRRFLDQGFRTKKITSLKGEGTIEYTQVLDSAGKPVSRPVKLDGHGLQLTADYDKVPWFLYVRDFDLLPFSVWNLE